MMRWMLLAVLVVALSAAATVAVQFLPSSESDAGTAPVLPKQSAGPAPAVDVAGGTSFNFGTLPQMITSSHAWVVKNVGKADLKLMVGPTSCKCTVANLGAGGEAAIKPGEPTEIRLEWNTKDGSVPFHQTATINTNDPLHPQLVFEVNGEVQPPIVMWPPEPAVNLPTVQNDKGEVVNKAFFSPDRPGFKITSVTSSRPDLLDATVKPMDADQVKQFASTGKVKTGLLMDVRVKPSTALGPFSEELLIATDHPSRPELRLIVMGRLVGPINVAPEEVRLTNLAGDRGGQARLSIYVRGREDTRFTVTSAPTPLKVEVKPADEQARAAGPAASGRQYRLTVTVPPGTPPGEIVGTIELKTDHPQAGRISVPVRIVVVGAS